MSILSVRLLIALRFTVNSITRLGIDRASARSADIRQPSGKRLVLAMPIAYVYANCL